MILRGPRTAVLILIALVAGGCSDHDHDHSDGIGDSHGHDHHGDAHAHDHHDDAHTDHTVIDATSAREAGVLTAVVGGGPIIDSLMAMGSIRPVPGAESLVTARFPGVIRRVNVRVGDRVNKGDEVVIIDGNLSLAPYAVTAPSSGVVAEQILPAGAAVDGDAVLRIIDPSRLGAELLLFGGDVLRVKVGQDVMIHDTVGTRPVKGRVGRLRPIVETSTQGVIVEVNFFESLPSWPSGSAVTGQIILNDAPVRIRVSRSAIQSFDGKEVVFIRQGDVYQAQPVVLGRMDTNYAEVLSGLNGGEEVVVAQSFLIKADIEKSAAVHDH
jgi:membrane fusion protein, heavy metal efflux system